MFAVIKTGGKQYRVAANDTLKIDRVEGEVGQIVEIGRVLAHGEGEKVNIGSPFVEDATVTAEVVEPSSASHHGSDLRDPDRRRQAFEEGRSEAGRQGGSSGQEGRAEGRGEGPG